MNRVFGFLLCLLVCGQAAGRGDFSRVNIRNVPVPDSFAELRDGTAMADHPTFRALPPSERSILVAVPGQGVDDANAPHAVPLFPAEEFRSFESEWSATQIMEWYRERTRTPYQEYRMVDGKKELVTDFKGHDTPLQGCQIWVNGGFQKCQVCLNNTGDIHAKVLNCIVICAMRGREDAVTTVYVFHYQMNRPTS